MNSIFKFIDVYNVFVGAVITILSAVFGKYWYLFAAFLIFNIFDFASGWYRSRKLKQESSDAGFKGVMKKIWYWVLIAIAFIIAMTFTKMGTDLLGLDLSFLTLIGWFTLACLMINEIRSILENLVECGIHVPEVLIKGLAVAEKLINKEDEKETVSESDTGREAKDGFNT